VAATTEVVVSRCCARLSDATWEFVAARVSPASKATPAKATTTKATASRNHNEERRLRLSIST
jgi:hypothetical protein